MSRAYNENALTDSRIWDRHYRGRDLEAIELDTQRPSLIDHHLLQGPGTLFELGCGGSHMLTRSALLGWEVSGIDFHPPSVELLRQYLEIKGWFYRHLITADALTYDCEPLRDSFDMLVSFGFLEHFKNPAVVLEKWATTLRPGGRVISAIPNLFSINAMIFKYLDREYWGKHIAWTPEQLDDIHRQGGLVVEKNAEYTGKYDIQMLIPWGKIHQKLKHTTLIRVVRGLAHYGVGKSLAALPARGLKRINSLVMGVYRKPEQDGVTA